MILHNINHVCSKFIFDKIFYFVVGIFLFGCQTTQSNKISYTQEQSYDDSLPPFAPDTIDGILVKVGNEPILLSDLNQTVELYPNVSAKDALDGLIDEKVIEIKAKSLGIKITDEELTKSIEDFLKSQNFSETELKMQLESSGKTMEEYREAFKKEMIKQQLIGRAISPFITVSNDEVNRFYLQQTKNVKQVEKVKLRSLLIEVPQSHTGDLLTYEVVQKVDDEIKNQADFVGLVRQYSGAKTAKDDLGILPPKNPQELPKEIREKLAELQIGQVIGPFIYGHSVFFFQYLGVNLVQESDLYTHFDDWKNRLMNQKFNESLKEYLHKERSALKIVARPYNFNIKN